MMSSEIRTLLDRFRETLEHTALPGDLDGLAVDLVDHLIELHDGQRLTAPFLKLALDVFEDVPQVAQIVEPLARFAAHQSAAMGHREAQRSDALPWIASSYSDLEPKASFGALATHEAPSVSRGPPRRS